MGTKRVERNKAEGSRSLHLKKKLSNDPLTPTLCPPNSSPLHPVSPLNLVWVFGPATPTHDLPPYWHFSSIRLCQGWWSDPCGRRHLIVRRKCSDKLRTMSLHVNDPAWKQQIWPRQTHPPTHTYAHICH